MPAPNRATGKPVPQSDLTVVQMQAAEAKALVAAARLAGSSRAGR